jgi:TRAP-type C4-dicarboxylate transport system permease small subunit
MKKLILQIDRYTTGLSLHAACAVLAVISVLGLWQVVSRFVFEQPSTWTEEAMRRLMIWMVMLGTVAAPRRAGVGRPHAPTLAGTLEADRALGHHAL